MRAEGHAGYLVFVCQVGHSYSATTLLAEKEERLEEVLWSGVYLLEELGELLTDLASRGGLDDAAWPSGRRRIHRLHEQAKQLRRLLDENEPIDLSVGVVADRDPE